MGRRGKIALRTDPDEHGNTSIDESMLQVVSEYAMANLRMREMMALHKNKSQRNPLMDNDSFAGMIKAQRSFEPTCALAIVANAIWMGVEVDHEPPSAVSSALRQVFCAFFTAELAVRMLCYRRWCGFFTDMENLGVNLFDFVLVVCMIFEVTIGWLLGDGAPTVPGLGVIRTFRLARILRLVRFLPELAMLLKSLIAAVRSVALTSAMVLGVMYAFSIIMTTWAHNHTQRYECEGLGCIEASFGTIPKSFMTLTQIVCFDNAFSIINAVFDEDVVYGGVLLLFIICAGFTLLNVLIGIICEIVAVTSGHQSDKWIQEQLDLAMAILDSTGNGVISRRQAKAPHAVSVLGRAGVDDELATRSFDFLECTENGTVPVAEYADTLLTLMREPQAQDVMVLERKLEKLERHVVPRVGEGRRIWSRQAADIVAKVDKLEAWIAVETAELTAQRKEMQMAEAAFDQELVMLNDYLWDLGDMLQEYCDENPKQRKSRAQSCWRQVCREVFASIQAGSALMSDLLPGRREDVDI